MCMHIPSTSYYCLSNRSTQADIATLTAGREYLREQRAVTLIAPVVLASADEKEFATSQAALQILTELIVLPDCLRGSPSALIFQLDCSSHFITSFALPVIACIVLCLHAPTDPLTTGQSSASTPTSPPS